MTSFQKVLYEKMGKYVIFTVKKPDEQYISARWLMSIPICWHEPCWGYIPLIGYENGNLLLWSSSKIRLLQSYLRRYQILIEGFSTKYLTLPLGTPMVWLLCPFDMLPPGLDNCLLMAPLDVSGFSYISLIQPWNHPPLQGTLVSFIGK